MWMSEKTAWAELSCDEVPPPMNPGKLPTAGCVLRVIENRPYRLFFAETVWSTRISPWVRIRKPRRLVEEVAGQCAGRPEVRVRDQLGDRDRCCIQAILRDDIDRERRRNHHSVR